MEFKNKTTAEVVREYDPKWDVVNKSLHQVLALGERDLGRIVDMLDSEFLTGGDNAERQNKYRLMQRQKAFILNDQLVYRKAWHSLMLSQSQISQGSVQFLSVVITIQCAS